MKAIECTKYGPPEFLSSKRKKNPTVNIYQRLPQNLHHRGIQVFMSHMLLDRSDMVSRFQKMRNFGRHKIIRKYL